MDKQPVWLDVSGWNGWAGGDLGPRPHQAAPQSLPESAKTGLFPAKRTRPKVTHIFSVTNVTCVYDYNCLYYL